MGAQSSDEELLSVSKQEVIEKDFKSLFYATTVKQDCTTRVYKKDARIDVDELILLNDRITEKLKMYNDAGFLVTVNVKFSNGKHQTFSGWKAFSEHKWYESEPINNITIVWEFNAILPQFNIPQRHTLTVKMTNSMRPEEIINIIFTGNLQTMEEFDTNFFPIVARVDFIDRVLGEELLNIVSDWVKGLSESDIIKSKWVMLCKRHKAKLASILNIITNLVIMISSVVLLNNYIRTLSISTLSEMVESQILYVIDAVFICAGIWILSKRLINVLTDRIYELLKDYGDNWLFNITKGDKNRIDKLNKIEKANKVSILINLIGTIILNIICSVIANKLF